MKMKFGFPEVLAILGILLWTTAFFFGFNYTQNGNLAASIPVTVVVLIALCGFLLMLKAASSSKNNRAFDRRRERVFGVLYLAVVIFSGVYVCHFVSVFTDTQATARAAALDELNQLKTVFGEADEDENVPAGSYLAWIEETKQSYRTTLENEGMSGSSIDVASDKFEDDLVLNSGFAELQAEVLDNIDKWEPELRRVIWLRAPEYIAQIEARKVGYIEDAIACSRKHDFTADDAYAPAEDAAVATGIVEPVATISGASFGVWAIVVVILLQVLILPTYFIRRETYFVPKKGWSRNSAN